MMALKNEGGRDRFDPEVGTREIYAQLNSQSKTAEIAETTTLLTSGSMAGLDSMRVRHQEGPEVTTPGLRPTESILPPLPCVVGEGSGGGKRGEQFTQKLLALVVYSW